MKKDIHPTHYPNAKIKCACGAEFIIAATKEDIEIETCSNCHPIYTGKERGVVRGGRVEKFQERAGQKRNYKKKSEKRASRHTDEVPSKPTKKTSKEK